MAADEILPFMPEMPEFDPNNPEHWERMWGIVRMIIATIPEYQDMGPGEEEMVIAMMIISHLQQ